MESDGNMFKEKLTLENILVKDSVEDWKDAVRESCSLLEASGSAPAEYKEKIIETINEIGPYIFIAPEIALPHVQLFGKTDIGVSLLKLNKSVKYDDERDARLFFAFSAKDGDSHINLIQELAVFLSDDENVSGLLELDSAEDIFDYIQQHG